MAYRSRATDIPHTRRPRARPTPAGREGSDSLGRKARPSTSHSVCENAGNKRGWSGSQVRLTRLELTIYRTEHFRPLAPNPSTSPSAEVRDLGPRRAISGDLALSRAISGPRRAISGDLGASLARRHTCSKRKEVGGRRSRPIQSAVVAGFLAPGSSPDGCCAGQQTIGRRDDAPSGTLPPPPGYCRTSALRTAAEFFPRASFLGPPATPTDFPSPHLRRNHRRDCRRCAPWRLCMSRVPARQGWCQGQLNCQGWCQGQINCLAGAKAQRLSSLGYCRTSRERAPSAAEFFHRASLGPGNADGLPVPPPAPQSPP